MIPLNKPCIKSASGKYGDYADFMFCDKEMVDELFPQAELFIKSVDELLKE